MCIGMQYIEVAIAAAAVAEATAEAVATTEERKDGSSDGENECYSFLCASEYVPSRTCEEENWKM